ncbi:ABC transporter permease [Lutispora sp.]|nr:ABC transporter permease [Lutispora sp.]MEA4960928.1 ABC transporter permease [Lutispora sp.]HCJ58177.1 peptide ABC transporter permease [Clostridiaceae bacterium]
MVKFIIKRSFYGIFTIFVIITITFFLIHAIPGDPMAQGEKHLPKEAYANFRAKYHLDQPMHIQYIYYLKGLITKGDLGESLIYTGRTVNDTIINYAPTSAVIGAQAAVIEIVFGLLLGIVAALKRGKWVDQFVMFLVILGVCVPSFVFASLLQYFCAVKHNILPLFGWGEFKHTIMPSIALALGGIASYSKYMRNSTLSVVNEDYIVTARAKGVSTFRLIFKHILRNAMIPMVTLIAPNILFIFTGAFVVERMFAVPGIGAYFVNSVNLNDYSMIMGLTIFVAVLYIISLIFVDIIYGLVDPRIRVAKGGRE